MCVVDHDWFCMMWAGIRPRSSKPFTGYAIKYHRIYEESGKLVMAYLIILVTCVFIVLIGVLQIYRFGQDKRVYTYRLVSFGTAEHVKYRMQVDKQGLAK